jgi:multidrug efflux system membrane fusion protein
LPVEATFERMNGDPVQGQLTFIDNAVDSNSGTIQLKATFPNEDDRLWPGQFVRVQLTLSQLPGAIVVPTQAVQTGQNGEYVYVVKQDQTVDERSITIGTAYQGMTVVEKGLTNDEVVVTDGQMRLTPGTEVSFNTGTNSAARPTAK